jgi:hypothetical protein
MKMNSLNVNKTLGQLALASLLVSALQGAAIAQNNAGYYGLIPPKFPIDIRMAALYERVDGMYNAGFFAPQERAELMRTLDGIQTYEMKARCMNTFGMSKVAAQRLNRQLDVFTSRLDARGGAS